MSLERLVNRPVKDTVVTDDIFFVGDSSNSFNEVRVAYGDIPGNSGGNPIPNFFTENLTIYNPTSATHYTTGTMSLTGSVVTLSGGTFADSMLGAMIVWNDGNFSLINNITGSTTATVGVSTTSSESSQTTNIYSDLVTFLNDLNGNFAFAGIPQFILMSNIMTLWSGTTPQQRAVFDLSALSNGGGTYQFPDLNGISVTKQFVMNSDVDVTSGSPTMARYTTYYSNSAATITLNVPSTIAEGDWFRVQGKGTGAWVIQLALGQTAYLTSSTHTSTSRSITATDQFNAITLRALSTTVLGVEAFNGTFTWA